MHAVEAIIQACIITTVQSLLPMQDIIQTYVTSESGDADLQVKTHLALPAIPVPESTIDLSESRQLLEDLTPFEDENKATYPSDTDCNLAGADKACAGLSDEFPVHEADHNSGANDVLDEELRHDTDSDGRLEEEPTSAAPQSDTTLIGENASVNTDTEGDNGQAPPGCPIQEGGNLDVPGGITSNELEILVDDTSHEHDDAPQLHLQVSASDIEDENDDGLTAVNIDYGSDSSRNRAKPPTTSDENQDIKMYMELSDDDDDPAVQYAYTDDELSDKEEDIDKFITNLREKASNNNEFKPTDVHVDESSSAINSNPKLQLFVGDLGTGKKWELDQKEQAPIFSKKQAMSEAAIPVEDHKMFVIADPVGSDDSDSVAKPRQAIRKKRGRPSQKNRKREKVALFPDAVSEDEL